MTSTPSPVSQTRPNVKHRAPTMTFWRRSGQFSQHGTAYIGIDVGEHNVRVATLRSSDRPGNEHAWVSRHQFALPTERDQDMTPQWLQEVLTSIHQRLPRCIEGESNVAAIALPIAWTHYQTVVGNDIPQARHRCSEMFRQSVFQSDAHLCHWPVVGVHHGHPCGEDQYVIAATAEQTACQITDIASANGFNVQSILPHGVALAHAAESLTGIDAQAVLWLGHASVLVSVRHQTGVGLTRTLPSLPEQILELDQPDRPLDAHTLRPYLTEIATEFRATARYAARADMGGVSTKPLLIAGPLAEIQGVDEIIATLTETPVAIWSYSGPQRPTTLAKYLDRDVEFVRRLDSSYAGALSLAWAATRCSSRGYGR
ncbi:hypothetical protein Enr13x_31990 [Stieleria neptunia]|uniref:Competence protein A n=1 Tax=Stieleria neptunia TaxID=2527979 RepID=A0A518HR77_9BACT|nr:hypothetical protein [Stieleria neptunia]QDV43344.1 hypothetical protein Enr13x_31990 [Stieleria neptunia]